MAKEQRQTRHAEHGNFGESEHPTTVGVGHIGESPETEMNVGGGTRTIRIDDEVSQISAGEPGLRTTSPPGGVGMGEEEEVGEEEL